MKITNNKSECIGCSSCAIIAPDIFEMDDNYKATIKNSKKINGIEELVIDENKKETAIQAAQSCPMGCINVFDDNNQKIS